MIQLTPLHPQFGARVDGADLSAALGVDAVRAILEAFEQYSVLLFRAQTLDDESQMQFSREFGTLEPVHSAQASGRTDYIARIGNIDANGNQLPAHSQRVQYLRGNEMWHTDSSFRDVPAMASMLYAWEVPPEGGNTKLVSTRAAYQRLPASMRQSIDGLTVIHDFVYSRSQVGPGVVSNNHAAMLPPVHHKLVRRNPVTGEAAYFVGSHARDIEGLDHPQSRRLIDDLMSRATRPQDIYTHRWLPGDLLIWDNRCILHCGEPYDADRYRRKLHRTTIAGLGPTRNEA